LRGLGVSVLGHCGSHRRGHSLLSPSRYSWLSRNSTGSTHLVLMRWCLACTLADMNLECRSNVVLSYHQGKSHARPSRYLVRICLASQETFKVPAHREGSAQQAYCTLSSLSIYIFATPAKQLFPGDLSPGPPQRFNMHQMSLDSSSGRYPCKDHAASEACRRTKVLNTVTSLHLRISTYGSRKASLRRALK
jgi:hypothetical protein